METCYAHPHPRPNHPKSSTFYPTLYKSSLNESIPLYSNGGFFINPTSSQNGCTYVADQIPSTSFLSSTSSSTSTDENRIIVNGTSGPLPSVSTLTTTCNSSSSRPDNDNPQLSLMLPRIPGNALCGGHTNFTNSSGTVPSMISGAPGVYLGHDVFLFSFLLLVQTQNFRAGVGSCSPSLEILSIAWNSMHFT